jgi:hypothetical protein
MHIMCEKLIRAEDWSHNVTINFVKFAPGRGSFLKYRPLLQGLAVRELITPSHIDKLEKAGIMVPNYGDSALIRHHVPTLYLVSARVRQI